MDSQNARGSPPVHDDEAVMNGAPMIGPAAYQIRTLLALTDRLNIRYRPASLITH